MTRVCEFCESHCLKLTDQSDQAQIAIQTKLQIDEQAILDEINRAKDISPAADAALASCAQKVGWTAFSPSPNQSVGQLVRGIPGTVSFLDSFCSIFMYFLRNWQAVELEQEIDTATKERQMRDNFSAKHVLPSSLLRF